MTEENTEEKKEKTEELLKEEKASETAAQEKQDAQDAMKEKREEEAKTKGEKNLEAIEKSFIKDQGEILPEHEEEEEKPLIEKKKKKKEEEPEKEEKPEESGPKIFALRTTANREDQVMSFVVSNAQRKKLNVFSVIFPHGMRGYIFLEAATKTDAEQAAFGVPYARGILPKQIQYKEIEPMLEQIRKEINVKKNDIAEIISGPFKREKCKVTRIDKVKEEVVVELLEAAVPIPITVKLDSIKVIRRDEKEPEEERK